MLSSGEIYNKSIGEAMYLRTTMNPEIQVAVPREGSVSPSYLLLTGRIMLKLYSFMGPGKYPILATYWPLVCLQKLTFIRDLRLQARWPVRHRPCTCTILLCKGPTLQ